MKLTGRGWAVFGVVVVAIGSAVLFGPRGLNAVAAPGVVALLAAVIQVRRIEPPVVTRDLPRRGHRGTTVRVRLDVDVEKPFSARVRDEVHDGLSADGNVRETTVRGRTLEYDLHLDARGSRAIGPTTIEARDVLGLVAEQFRYARRDQLLVLPRVYLLAGPAREDLVRLYGGSGDDRQEFDHLRHYQRGDPLRDIHWKSSAKETEGGLVVKEFTTDEGAMTIEVVAEARDDTGDDMADAAASVVADLLDAGLRVGLTTPSGRVPPDEGPAQRGRVLDHLATAEAGLVSAQARSRAHVAIDAGDAGIRVDIGGRSRSFAELAGEHIEGRERSAVEVAAT